jgi:hypothetical protein
VTVCAGSREAAEGFVRDLLERVGARGVAIVEPQPVLV